MKKIKLRELDSLHTYLTVRLLGFRNAHPDYYYLDSIEIRPFIALDRQQVGWWGGYRLKDNFCVELTEALHLCHHIAVDFENAGFLISNEDGCNYLFISFNFYDWNEKAK